MVSHCSWHDARRVYREVLSDPARVTYSMSIPLMMAVVLGLWVGDRRSRAIDVQWNRCGAVDI